MIFLTGPHGSGKTESAQIMRGFGFLPVDLGPTLRKICFEQKDSDGLEMWIKQGETMFGPYFTDRILIEEIRKTKKSLELDKNYKDIVIVGNRSRVGIENIASAFPNCNNNHIIFIDAPFNMLKDRYNSREKTKLDSAGFYRLLEKDLKIGLNSIRDIADITICNDGDIDSLETKIKEIIFKKLCYETKPWTGK